MRSVWAICATGLLAACPAPRGVSRATTEDRLARIRIAKLEAARDHGQVGLAQLVRDGELTTSSLALRGLGRVNTTEAGRALVAYAGGAEGGAASSALGLASALDEPSLEVTTLRTDALLSAYRSDTEHRVPILEAMGRAGDLRALPVLAAALGSTDYPVAATAGIALGRFGRRKLALDAVARAALVTATRSPDRSVRYAATYALRLEITGELVAATDAVAAALAARITDEDAETRAQAIVGLTKRAEVDAARAPLEHALVDRDWRVAVEAVRALGGPHGGPAGHAAVVAVVPRWTAQLATDPRAEHVVLEALRTLAPVTDAPTLAPMLRALAVPAAAPPLVRGWIACLALAARARHADATLAEVGACSRDLPDHLRLPLVAELLGEAVGDAAARRTALGLLLAHADVRVRATALGALAGMWADGTADDHEAALATLAAALGAGDAVLAGAAVDAVPELAKHATADELLALDAALIARATKEMDPELAASLLELIGARKIASGLAACRAGLAGHRVRAKAADGCMRALGEPPPPAPPSYVPPEPAPPPVDVSTVIGKSVRWRLVTTRGEIVIALRPDVAPWAVATIVQLTRAGFYDKHEMHRVVPDFVAQGGDPTETGQGGPGFTLPAEPATTEDGPGFVTGGVGMADAGPDSGGSQWFIMHARAPHLDGRYTWVGNVESGLNVSDSLVIGDVVEHATVELSDLPARP